MKVMKQFIAAGALAVLLDHQHEQLGLTGTKRGCDGGECGACTVFVDDVPRYACSVLTHSVRAKKIQTIEGLAAADGTLHPVQRGVARNRASSAPSACRASSWRPSAT